MRGLLLKDWYTLVKQMRIMLLILVVFACMPDYSMAPFAVFYAAMLPVTALAYDERSKWEELAGMMPYSAKSIVLCKYVLGVFSVLAAALIACAAQLCIAALRHTGFASGEMPGLLLIACLSLILLSINLPLMFRLGVEKGRVAFMILICGGAVGSMALREQLFGLLEGRGNAALPLLGAMLLTGLMLFLSVPISVAMYKKRKG